MYCTENEHITQMPSSAVERSSLVAAGAWYKIFQNFGGKERKLPKSIQTCIYQTVINQGPTIPDKGKVTKMGSPEFKSSFYGMLRILDTS
jgi:hypothetical protein